MTKKEFLSRLRRQLRPLSMAESRERIGFYSEIIDDKIEEGLSEEDAVADVGSVEDIAAEILADSPTAASRAKKAVSPWQIALLIIGAPVWLPILISVYAVLWSVSVTLWAVEIPLYILGFIAKHLGTLCVAFTKFCARITKKCTLSIFRG